MREMASRRAVSSESWWARWSLMSWRTRTTPGAFCAVSGPQAASTGTVPRVTSKRSLRPRRARRSAGSKRCATSLGKPCRRGWPAWPRSRPNRARASPSATRILRSRSKTKTQPLGTETMAGPCCPPTAALAMPATAIPAGEGAGRTPRVTVPSPSASRRAAARMAHAPSAIPATTAVRRTVTANRTGWGSIMVALAWLNVSVSGAGTGLPDALRLIHATRTRGAVELK